MLVKGLYASTPNLRNHGSKTSLKPADRPKEANSLSAVFPWKHIGRKRKSQHDSRDEGYGTDVSTLSRGQNSHFLTVNQA